jgi:cytochrome c peroxidase
MHDGRIFSLLQVVSYYQTGIDITQPTLDPLLKNRLSFTNQEKVDLIEFLLTLTDDVLLHDNRLSQSK